LKVEEVQLSVQSLLLQCRIAEVSVLLMLEKWKDPERYEPGTIVDGKNVGGKWKPGDKSGAQRSVGDAPSSVLQKANQAVQSALSIATFQAAKKQLQESFKTIPAIAQAIQAEPDPLMEFRDDLDQPVPVQQVLKRAIQEAKRSPKGRTALAELQQFEKQAGITQKDWAALSSNAATKPFIDHASAAEKAITLNKTVQLAAQKYRKLIDSLENLDDSHSKFEKLLGKAAAHAIPIAAFVAAISPEVAIGLFVKQGLGAIAANIAAGQGLSYLSGKVLDRLNIKNPVTRIGVDLAIGVGVSGGIAKIAAKRSKTVADVATKAAKAGQDQFADAIAKAVSTKMPSEAEIRATGTIIGKGAAGEVFKHPEADVVYKLFKSEAASFNDLKQEIEISTIAGELNAGAKVLAVGENGYAMEFLKDYRSLSRAMKEANPAQKQKLLDALVDQVAVLHQHNIEHGDLHGLNVLVSPDGKDLKVIDYGLAAMGKDADPSFDILGLGNLITDTFAEQLIRATGREAATVPATIKQRVKSRALSNLQIRVQKEVLSGLGEGGLNPEKVKKLKENIRKVVQDLQGDRLAEIVREEISKGSAIESELGAAALPSLKELLKERRQLMRSQKQERTQEQFDRIAEINSQIFLSEESLSTEEAYGLMAD